LRLQYGDALEFGHTQIVPQLGVQSL
jgi:hypothetical protein